MWALSSHLCWYRWHISHRTLHIFVIQIVLFGQVKKSEKLSKQTREMFVLVFPGKFVSIYLHAVRCRSPAFERNHPMERHRVTCGRHENAFLIDIWSKLMPKGRKRRTKRQEIFSQLCCGKMRHVSLTKSQSIRWTFWCECSSFSH